ncbi:MAG: mechanosensitive ion channel [Candidatus Cloacimonetes bacterium]|nr:mechanosensitive ion channel [Candidatus Cloacimonadota bacterium]
MKHLLLTFIFIIGINHSAGIVDLLKPNGQEVEKAKIENEALEQEKQAQIESSKINEINAQIESLLQFEKNFKLGENKDLLLPKKPTSWKDTQDVEAFLSTLEEGLKSQREKLQVLINDHDKLAQKRLNLPKIISTLRQTVSELERIKQNPNLAPNSSSNTNDKLDQLKNLKANTLLKLHEKEIEVHPKQLQYLDQEIKWAKDRQLGLEALLLKERESLRNMRQKEAEKAKQRATEVLQKKQGTNPELEKIVKRNAELADLQAKLGTQLDGYTTNQERISRFHQKLKINYQSLSKKMNAVGSSRVIAVMLRQQKLMLPDQDKYSRLIASLEDELIQLQTQSLLLEEELELSKSQFKRDTLNPDKAILKDVINEKIKIIDKLVQQHQTCILRNVDLSAQAEGLLLQIESVKRLVMENILWIRSTSDLNWVQFYEAWINNFQSLLASTAASRESTFKKIATAQYWQLFFATLLSLLALFTRAKIIALIEKSGSLILQKQVASFASTLKCFFLTFGLAVFWPATLLVLANWCQQFDNIPKLILLGNCIEELVVLVFLLNLSVCCLLPKGLGEAHFLWQSKSVQNLRYQLIKSRATLFVLFFCMSFTYWFDNIGPVFQVGFIIFHLAFSYHLFHLFHPSKPWLADGLRWKPKGWFKNVLPLVFVILVAIPLALSVTSFFGFHLTALELSQKFFKTMCWLMTLILLKSLCFRIFFNLRKARFFENYQDPTSTPTTLQPQEIQYQIRRFLDGSSAIIFVVGLWWLWLDVLPALNRLHQYRLWLTHPTALADIPTDLEALRKFNELYAVTLIDCLLSLVIIFFTFVSVRNLPALLEVSLLRKLKLEAGQSFAVVTIFRYSLIFIGTTVALGNIGIGWQNIQWLAAAFTVGLGFGLQEIFANLVSGLIILFEQPIRVNDIVTIDQTSGTVNKINMRSTTITLFNNKELVVPNKDLITGKLVNWSLTDATLRLELKIGVAYKEDPLKIKEILYKVASRCDRVLTTPEPFVMFQGYGASSIDFELRVYIGTIANYTFIWDQLYTEIFEEFKKEDIEIPFNQVDLHIKDSSTFHHVAMQT